MPEATHPPQSSTIFTTANVVIFTVDALLLLMTILERDWVWGLAFVGAAFWSYRRCFRRRAQL